MEQNDTKNLTIEEVNTIATKAREEAQTALKYAKSAMDDVIGLRNDLNRVGANVNDNLPGMNVSINKIETDVNAFGFPTKFSELDEICRRAGKQQGDLRIYSSEECDALNGIYHANGECTNKDGGSFSEKCGMLYKWTNSTGVTYTKGPPQIPYGTTSKKNEGDYKNNWAAVYGSDSAVPAVPVGGRRKRTRRGKGRRRGTRRYRK